MKRLKKTPNHPLLLVFLLVTLTACSQSGSFGTDQDATLKMSENYSATAAMDAMETEEEYATESASDQASGGEQSAVTETKIIRTGDMQIEVADYAKARTQLTDALAAFEYQVMNESEEKLSYRIQNQLELKVDPAQLDSVVTAIAGIALHLDRKSIRARDVTKQYVDLETRLASKRAVVTRYREILKSARTVEEILAVEDNLRKVVEEIESVEGQLRYLKDQVQFSTLHVLMYQSYETPEVRRRSFGNRIGKALTGGWSVFQELVIGMVSIWPIILLIGVFVWWLMRRWRGKVKR
ncbi:MAG: hypothetical protein DHS20C18_13730 [Saprospiraceae bacterium]|nr:MAG: hypothetical protein DHS20C18_13730 [Saprospiraceae bacterium]